jgi:cephalosporin hydroxylase
MNGHRFTIVPTMYQLGNAESGKGSFCYYGDYIDDLLTPVAATGAAFLLIHRSALDKIRAEWGDHWFDQFYDGDGDIIGEDIAFSARVLKAGMIPHVHTGIKTTHHKDLWLGEADYMAQRAVTVRLDPALPVHIDLQASIESLAGNAHVNGDMLKLPADLDRYRQIIDATRPDVIVETGTRTGGSARWFADLGVDVVTVDLHEVVIPEAYKTRVTQVVGDSADPSTLYRVAALVGGRRTMVSLDSDHSGPHVAAEIGAYGPLVSPGCYLVVEDGIFGHAPDALRAQHGLADMVGSPLDAIAELLVDAPGWSRDVAIERTSPISHHPAGWWLRHG